MKRFFCALAIASMLVMAALTQEKSDQSAMESLANAERAFAKYSVDHGVREAFITFFAEDGINFQPHPTNTIESYRNRPAPTTPPQIVLKWSPIYGDISQAGDIGYTTGPYTLEDRSPAKRPTQHGMYSSVWKKQADGSWKVLIDLGIQLDSAFAPLDAPFQVAPRWKVNAVESSVEDSLAELLNADREFFQTAKKGSTVRAWQKFLSDDARIHRNQIMPIIGKAALQAWSGKQPSIISGEPIKAEVARSADFAYSYGKYEAAGEKGYYVRVWKRDEKGNWRITFDVTAPLPEEKK